MPFPSACPTTSHVVCSDWPIARVAARPSTCSRPSKEHLDDLEDLYLAEQRLVDLRAGKSGTVPLEEVMKRYGMDDRA